MLRRWNPVESIDALGGDGVIAGELSGDPEVPNGLLTVNGVPTSREIEVRDRKTRRVVSVRRSNTDGTYRFPGLNPALQYDVIARDFAGDYEDVIAGAVCPHTPDLIVPVAAGGKMAAFVDPYGPAVVSLLHFDGTDGSTTFADQAGMVWTKYGNARIDTAQSKFGGASGIFEGAGNYIRVASSAAFAYGNGDFTWEAWLRLASTSGNQYVIEHGVNGGTVTYNENRLTYYNPTIGVSSVLYTTGGGTLSANIWYHVAVARQSGTTRFFVGGVLKSSASDAHMFGSENVLVGAYGGGGFNLNGHVDELRITKGVARYTANFTPPTAPFEL